MRGKKIAAVQGENVCPAWDDFSSLQHTPFHCEVQMSCNKKLCSGSSGAAVQTGSSAERTLLYEQKQHFETLMIAAPIGLLFVFAGQSACREMPYFDMSFTPGCSQEVSGHFMCCNKAEHKKENTKERWEIMEKKVGRYNLIQAVLWSTHWTTLQNVKKFRLSFPTGGLISTSQASGFFHYGCQWESEAKWN